ncbi:MAG: acyl-CoA thioesterase [Gemmatimonadales bacterium]|nr:acyl-CoA thioesterase [Gemmatimonadales bacterium]
MSNQTVFKLETQIMLRHTDAAGVLFFPRLHEIAHQAVEKLLALIGFPLSDMISGKLHHLPIVHAEADYNLPCRLGDKLSVEVLLHKLGDHSLGFTCNFLDSRGEIRAITRVDHAAIDPHTGLVTELNQELKTALSKLQSKF